MYVIKKAVFFYRSCTLPVENHPFYKTRLVTADNPGMSQEIKDKLVYNNVKTTKKDIYIDPVCDDVTV